jgi:hypothetical protein
MRWFAILLWVLLAGPAQAQGVAPRVLPDWHLTPGSIDPALTPKFLCSHPTSDRRNVPSGLRKQVFAAYNVPISTASKYEIDHFIPLALGGVNTCSDNPTCNLWPQPHQKSFPQIAPWGSETKDALEARLYRTMCSNHAAVKDANWLNNARVAMTSNWESAYQQYVGNAPGTQISQPSRSRKSKHSVKH